MSDSKAMPWRLVIASAIGMFAATATGSSRSPFLPDMASELGVSLPAIANLFGVTAAAWGLSSYLVGSVSDRTGRAVFLVGSPVCVSLAMLFISQVQSYPVLVAAVVFAGLCCGAFTATAMAEVSIRAAPAFHGRALGYVMSGQSLTLLFGIPLAAWLGASLGWRGVHMLLAALSAFAVLCMLLALQSNQPVLAARKGTKGSEVTLRQAMTGPVVRLFIALVGERVCFGLAAFYYASYLRTVYHMPIQAVALPLAGFAVGNIIGTIAGGQLADRFPYRRVSFAVTITIAGCIAVPWFLWRPGAGITISLGILFAFFNALSRPSLLAAMADVPAEVRGAVMGLNSSIASIGWLAAALVGGWLYASVGFGGFSLLMVCMCLTAALIVLPDSRIRQQHNV